MRIKPYFVVVFALMIMMSSTVSAATITVDDSGGQAHTTIQAAINAANDSDTILVYPGTYTENVDVYKELTIISQSGNPADTHVQAADSGDHVFNVTRDKVNISGFNVTGATNDSYAGIYLDEVQHNNISNNTVSNNWHGIWLDDSSNNTLNNNTASNNRNGIILADSNNNTLNNNTALNNDDGINLEFSNNNTLNKNIALNNSVGILIDNSDENTLDNNNASNNDEEGIFLDHSSNNTLNTNNASNNDKNGIQLGDSSNNNTLTNNTANSNKFDGIYLASASNNTLNNNTVSDNVEGISLIRSSFLVQFCSNNSLSNNTVSNNVVGILLRDSSNNNLTSNMLCNNNDGIVLSISSNNLIYNNYFNNTNNTQISAGSTGNVWNIAQTAGPNIIGGPFLGGNYWATPAGTGHGQTCADANNDGFCDSQFDIDASNTDYLPLTINASIDIEKSTNGEDADVALGPSIQFGQTVTWTYNVTNNGNVILKNITVIDDKLGEITSPSTTLQPGESMVCTAIGAAQLGQYSNFGNVTAVHEGLLSCGGGTIVSDSDPSHYFGYRSGGGGLPYEPPEGVSTINPFLLVGTLGIVLVLFLRRELK